MVPINDNPEPLSILELARIDPGDGHRFWQATVDWCGVPMTFHDRWGRWLTEDFSHGEAHKATGWLVEALDAAVRRRLHLFS